MKVALGSLIERLAYTLLSRATRYRVLMPQTYSVRSCMKETSVQSETTALGEVMTLEKDFQAEWKTDEA